MSQKKRLGEMLVEAGVISAEQLEHALRLQQESRKLLGQLLIEMGWTTEREIGRAAAAMLNRDYVEIDGALVSQDAIRMIPAEVAVKQHLLPLWIQDQTLYLTLENTLDNELAHQIEATTGLLIKSLIAPPVQLQAAIRKHYNIAEYVGQMLDNLPAAEPDHLQAELEIAAETAENGEIQALEERRQMLRLLNLFVAHGIQTRASDVQFEFTEKQVFLRYTLDGIPTRGSALPQWLQLPLLAALQGIAGITRPEQKRPQTGCVRMNYDQRKLNLRVSTEFTETGEAIRLHICDPKTAAYHLNRLGLSAEQQSVCRQMIQQPQGWIIVTAPPCGGKTTTLYALLNAIKGSAKTVITLENPVEHHLGGIDQFQLQPGAEKAFSRGLQAILEQQPANAILVGEIRDADTAALAVQAAATGQLVFSPLHASDAVAALPRLFHLGVAPNLAAAHLLGVIAQRLVRRICPQCKTQYMPTAQELQQLGLRNETALECYHGIGCKTCQYTGYYGQTGLYEFFVPDERLRDAILRCPTQPTLRKLASDAGMETLFENGLKKVRQGLTTLAEVARVCQTAPAEPERTVTCPKCGKTIMKTENICPFCRSRLCKPCVQCGAELEREWSACPFCRTPQRNGLAATLSPLPQQPARKIRIVLADSDEATRNLAAAAIDRAEYEIFTAGNGEEALEKITRERPDLILLALNLPKGDGFAICKMLRANAETMFLPVILLTTQQTLAEKLQGVAAGATGYLSKPLHPDQFADHIASILRRSYPPANPLQNSD